MPFILLSYSYRYNISPHPTSNMQTRTLLRFAGLVAVLSSSFVAARAQITTITPFASGTGYVTGGDVYAPGSGTHDGINTFAINTATATSNTRNLSVTADSNFNGGTLGGAVGSYSGTMPAVFGGFTASSSGASVNSQLTVRVQFQSGTADYVHVNTYQESGANTLAAGLTYRLATALMFSSGSVTDLASLTSLTYVGGATSYAAGTTATHRVVVRDAASGNFYVSSALNNAAGGTISLAGTQWGQLSSSNLTSIGSYATAAFTEFDYIGIYSDSSVITSADITGYTRVNGFSLSSLSYDLAPIPEPASAAALLGAGALGCVALRRRRSVL